jgi:hypothetical protein
MQIPEPVKSIGLMVYPFVPEVPAGCPLHNCRGSKGSNEGDWGTWLSRAQAI